MTDLMEPIVVEQVYSSTRDELWQAITNPEQMRQWFFETMESFEPTVGFETQFDVTADGKTYRHVWKIDEVEENSRISYHWHYDGMAGKSIVFWELSDEGDKTKLQLTHEELEPFPKEDDPNFSRESCIGGWNYFLKDRLVDFLEKAKAS